jgi:hypothetical protein
MPSLNPVRTLILSARAWRRISARHASTSSTSSTSWITWPDASTVRSRRAAVDTREEAVDASPDVDRDRA